MEEAFATIKIELYKFHTTNLKGKIDTGSGGNILLLRTLKQLYPAKYRLMEHHLTQDIFQQS